MNRMNWSYHSFSDRTKVHYDSICLESTCAMAQALLILLEVSTPTQASIGLSMEHIQLIAVRTQEADKEYWGLEEICRRMRWKNRRTPVRHALKFGFPLYLRTKTGQSRQFYYSNEKLITAWEWLRCEREIERLLNRVVPEQQQIFHPPSLPLP